VQIGYAVWALEADKNKKVKKGKVRYCKKSISGYISPICGAASSQPIPTILGTSYDLANIINRAKCHDDRLRVFGWAGT
jgi:hypothetical protein